MRSFETQFKAKGEASLPLYLPKLHGFGFRYVKVDPEPHSYISTTCSRRQERMVSFDKKRSIISILWNFILKSPGSGELETFDIFTFTNLSWQNLWNQNIQGGGKGPPCLTSILRKTGIVRVPLQIIREKTSLWKKLTHPRKDGSKQNLDTISAWDDNCCPWEFTKYSKEF